MSLHKDSVSSKSIGARLYVEYRKQEEENDKLRRDWRKKKYPEIEKDRKE
jgi:hypothetical protein